MHHSAASKLLGGRRGDLRIGDGGGGGEVHGQVGGRARPGQGGRVGDDRCDRSTHDGARLQKRNEILSKINAYKTFQKCALSLYQMYYYELTL